MSKKQAGNTLGNVPRKASSAEQMLPGPLEPCVNTAADENEIAALAYRLWQDRGCPKGSAEEDWYLAERELRGPSPEMVSPDRLPPEIAGTAPVAGPQEEMAA